jgi:hypothetical protein
VIYFYLILIKSKYFKLILVIMFNNVKVNEIISLEHQNFNYFIFDGALTKFVLFVNSTSRDM